MKTKTCLRYPGGKFYGSRVILPFLETEHIEYREIFLGGASIFLSKELAKDNWLNDRDEELITFYQVITDPDQSLKLFEKLQGEVATKERHSQVKAMVPKNKIDRAFRYFYLNRTSFSGIMVSPRWGYKIGSSLTPDHWIERIKPVAQKMKIARISSLDFRDVLDGGSERVLAYVDPPYFEASRNIYSVDFIASDHFELCEILKQTKMKFVLSYENSPSIQKMYSWANVHAESWVYYLSEQRRQEGRELIITNF